LKLPQELTGEGVDVAVSPPTSVEHHSEQLLRAQVSRPQADEALSWALLKGALLDGERRRGE
jgi:hypothetical protein